MFEDDETEDDVEEVAPIETSTVEQLVPSSSEQCHTSSIKPVVSSSEQRQSPVKTISQTVELDLTCFTDSQFDIHRTFTKVSLSLHHIH